MKRTTTIACALLVCLVAAVSAQNLPNQVRTKTFYRFDPALPDDQTRTFFGAGAVYSDGLARELHSSIQQPDGKGLVVGKTYDDVGRLSKTTVPFAAADIGYIPADDITTVARASRANEPEIGDPGSPSDDEKKIAYAETQYKEDALDRVEAVGAPGYVYSIGSGHGGRSWYMGTGVAKTDDDIDGNGFVKESILKDTPLNELLTDLNDLELYLNDHPANHPQFEAPDLFLSVSKGPNDREFSQVITDRFGRTLAKCGMEGILSKYEYDILGNLLKEIPPHPITSRNSDAAMATENRYNALGQLIYKKTPDAGIVEYKYDKAGRLYLTQNARQNWAQLDPANYNVYLYDQLGRNYAIGINDGSNATDFGEIDPLDPAAELPTTLAHIFPRIQNVYDDPQNLSLALPSADVSTLISQLRNTKGKLVAAIAYDERMVHVLPTDVGFWSHVVVDLYSYDEDGRVVASYKRFPRMATFTKHTFDYDLQGNVLHEEFFDDYASLTEKWSRTYVYDKVGRLTEIYNSSEELIARYAFDDFGRMTTKSFMKGAADEVNGVAYHHNIRDWVRQIGSTSQTAGPFYFDEQISYATGPTPQYNGNISAINTSVGVVGNPKSGEASTYAYDNVNRLTALDNTFSEWDEDFTYQKNGRFATKAKGGVAGTYHYYPNSNRLNHIVGMVDADGNPVRDTENNYFYDPNGNMVLDFSKKMVVQYDWRDMPVAFRFYDVITPETMDWWTPDDWEQSIIDNGGKLLSEVRMFYDASGKRVLKYSVDAPSAPSASSLVLARNDLPVVIFNGNGTIQNTIVQHSTATPASEDFTVNYQGTSLFWVSGSTIHIAGAVSPSTLQNVYLAIESPGSSSRILLDRLGNISIKEPGLRHVEKYVDNYTVEQEYGGQGLPETSSEWATFADGRVDIAYSTAGVKSENTKFYYKDHLGSTRAVISDGGALVEALRYTAYGENIDLQSVTGTEPEANEKFTGKELDKEGRLEAGVVKLSLSISNITDLSPATVDLYFDGETQPSIGNVALNATWSNTYWDLEGKAYVFSDRNLTRVDVKIGDDCATGVNYQLTGLNQDVDVGKEVSITLAPTNRTALPCGVVVTDNRFAFAVQDAALAAVGMGLEYFGKRYYDAEIGRWVSTDPDMQFDDLYAYAGNGTNPISFADDDGGGIYTKIGKVIYKVVKTGDAASAFADNVQDALTVVNPAATPVQRVVAALSLASEILPVSAGDVKDAGRAVGAVKVAYSTSRPKYAKDQVEKTWKAAKQKDGRVYDPFGDGELQWDRSRSRAGQWDMGHKTPYKELKEKYHRGDITKEEFLKQYRDPDNYHPQSLRSNRNRKHDKKGQ